MNQVPNGAAQMSRGGMEVDGFRRRGVSDNSVVSGMLLLRIGPEPSACTRRSGLGDSARVAPLFSCHAHG